MSQHYSSAVIVIGGVFPDDVPKADWQRCREAELVLGRLGNHTRRVLKDRYGAPRGIDAREWDRLYVAVKGEKLTLRLT